MSDSPDLSRQDVAHVTASFARIFRAKAPVARAMYAALFAARPDLRALFPPDLAPQQEKVTEALVFVVRHLTMPKALLTGIDELALAHRNRGIGAAEFAAVGAALMAALGSETPGGLTEEEAAAWERAYALVAGRMCAQADGGG